MNIFLFNCYKDGPSAGVTITTALLSLASNTALQNVAMTGEISLNQEFIHFLQFWPVESKSARTECLALLGGPM